LVIAGIAALCHNALLQHDHADWPSKMQQLFMTLSMGLLLSLGLIFSAFYVQKL